MPADGNVADLDEQWETENGIRDFIAREEARGRRFVTESGVRRRLTGLMAALEEGYINRAQLAAGFQYANDYERFYNEYRFPSTLDYQSRVSPGFANDLIMSAGLRIRNAEERLSPAQRCLVRRACGEGRTISNVLMSQLKWAIDILNGHYLAVWSTERAAMAPMAAPIADLRGMGAIVHHRFEMGGPYHIIGAQDVLRCAQGDLCGICQKPIWPERGSLDHVVPRNRGVGMGWGFEGPGNLLLVHRQCNLDRGNAPPDAEMLRSLRRVNAILGWDRSADDDSEDTWRLLTEGLSQLPMVADDDPDLDAPTHYPATSDVKALGMSSREWARRKIALERTLARLERLRAAPEAPSVKLRSRPPPPSDNAAPAPEIDWNALLPSKPSRTDDTMSQSWLAAAGVVKSNRDMRHLGVQAKGELKAKKRAKGIIRKRVRRRGRS